MKKLLIILIYLVGICAGGWAQKASGVVEGALVGRVVAKALAKEMQITRDEKDFRILYFLGKTYKMHLGYTNIMNYFTDDGDGIAISKKETTLQEAVNHSMEAFEHEGYTVKSLDGRNPSDIIYSLYKQKGDVLRYEVVRLFPIGNNQVLQVSVGKKITQKDPLPLMRQVMQGVRATPQAVLNAGFPKSNCEFGDDCY